MRLAIVAHRATSANSALAAASVPGFEVCLLGPDQAVLELSEGDLALGRLDVMESLGGIERGLWELARLERAGVRVLNRPSMLVAAHDKLATARVLAESGLPHPRTIHVTGTGEPVRLRAPFVVKPRFGSWGRDVFLCREPGDLRRCLDDLSRRPWFPTQGALVQELVPPQGEDLRIVVAGGTVVGAIRRVAAPGEWRTNVALGARREPVAPSPAACDLAVAAAAAIGADLVGVDLLPTPDGGYVVIELNGAVEFNEQYSLDGDVFEEALRALMPDPVAAVA